MITKNEVLTALKSVIDPEIGVNVVDLGLVYGVQVSGTIVKINVTMTSPMCPLAGLIMEQCKQAVLKLSGVTDCEMSLVWSPQWTPEKMSEDGKAQMGMI